jgi:hypothetical protein
MLQISWKNNGLSYAELIEGSISFLGTLSLGNISTSACKYKGKTIPVTGREGP